MVQKGIEVTRIWIATKNLKAQEERLAIHEGVNQKVTSVQFVGRGMGGPAIAQLWEGEWEGLP